MKNPIHHLTDEERQVFTDIADTLGESVDQVAAEYLRQSIQHEFRYQRLTAFTARVYYPVYEFMLESREPLDRRGHMWVVDRSMGSKALNRAAAARHLSTQYSRNLMRSTTFGFHEGLLVRREGDHTIETLMWTYTIHPRYETTRRDFEHLRETMQAESNPDNEFLGAALPTTVQYALTTEELNSFENRYCNNQLTTVQKILESEEDRP